MPDDRIFLFGTHRLLAARRELLAAGVPVTLGGRAFDLLLALVGRAGEIVGKDALMTAAWPGVVVEENNLTMQVSALRRALGDGVDGRRYIVTAPGRGYRFVERVTLAASGGSVPARRPDPPAAPAPIEAAQHNLPRPVLRLIGRETELAELAVCVAGHRLVTLVGGGGLGKTRCALELGARMLDRFPDGVWFVPLERLSQPELVAETIAGTFGLAIPRSRSAAEITAGFLGRKRLLLILDNAEHLIEEVASIADAILGRGPELRILVTSREIVGVPAERVYRLPPLGLPVDASGLTAAAATESAAVRLFVERAGAAAGAFALTDETVGAVVEICRRLDGIALAIELAAARMKVLAPHELLDRLGDRFRFLAGGNRAAASRQQTLRATFDWSYDFLTPGERTLFRHLSVFGGSFTIEGAAKVAFDDPRERADILDLMAALVDKSLVSPLPADGAGRRFRLLELTRAYGLERLKESGEAESWRRLAGCLLEQFERAYAAYPTAATVPWLAAYAPELDNLRQGLEWAFGADGDADLGLRLVVLTAPLWTELSLLAERRRWFDAAAARLDASTPPEVVAGIKSALARTGYFGQGDVTALTEAASLYRDAGNGPELAKTLSAIGTAVLRPDSLTEAERYYREAETLLRPLGPTKSLANLLDVMALPRRFAGDLAGARALVQESLALARSLGHRSGIENLTANLAEIAFESGQLDEAIASAREAETASRASGNLWALAMIRSNLAAYLLAAGDAAGARIAACDGLRLNLALADGYAGTICLEHSALAAALVGETERAARIAGYTTAHYLAHSRTREPTEQAGWLALTARLEAALPPAELNRLRAQGAAWTEDEAAAAGLEEQGSAR